MTTYLSKHTCKMVRVPVWGDAAGGLGLVPFHPKLLQGGSARVLRMPEIVCEGGDSLPSREPKRQVVVAAELDRGL